MMEGRWPMAQQDALQILNAGIARIGELPKVCEPEFLRIGGELFAVIAALDGMQAQMGELRERLTGDDLCEARRALETSMADLVGLVHANHGDKASLPGLRDLIGRALARIAPLNRVIGEIGVLAVNAKIQASQVTAAGIDFSVFTREISRLGSMAGASVERCRQGLMGLDTAIDAANRSSETFERDRATSLADVKHSLDDGLAQLQKRDQQTAQLINAMKARSQEISSRISAVIAALQINDITMQRTGHVREALEVLVSLASGAHDDDGLAGREHLVIAAACRLQALQLFRAAEDFRIEVERVIADLGQLRSTTGILTEEAEQGLASGGPANEGSFVERIERDCHRALELLNAFKSADKDVRATVEDVAAGVRAMASDVEAIRSVEVDMRIMGLNATLKCGRLGKEGRALAVIAQELRAYSKRTGEDSLAIACLLTDISALGNKLTLEANGRRDSHIATVEDEMRQALRILSELGMCLSGTVGGIRSHGSAAASTMARVADGIGLHQSVPATIVTIATSLDTLADKLDPEHHGSELAEEVKALLRQNYTMESERIIHALFADGADDTAQMPASATESVEEFFL